MKVYFSVIVVLLGIYVYWFNPLAAPGHVMASGKDHDKDLMEAAVYARRGPIEEVVELKLVKKPLAQRDQVVVRVAYAALNPIDWKEIEGHVVLPMMCSPSKRNWCGISRDGAGTVVGIGPLVSKFKVGDAVVFQSPERAMALGEFSLVNEDYAFHLPAGWSLEKAAAMPTVGATSALSIGSFCRSAELEKGNKTVLVLGGGSATGMVGIYFAKKLGNRVIAVCGTR